MLSRIANDKRVLFREVFTPQSVSANSGIVTGGVTFTPDGATMDGTGYITYSGNKDLANKSQFTIRMKYRKAAVGKRISVAFRTDTNHRVNIELAPTGILYGIICNGGNSYLSKTATFDDLDEHDLVLVFDGSGVTHQDRTKMYEGGNLIAGMIYTEIIPSISTPTGTLWIGFNGTIGYSEGSFELVEIYDGALTETEVSLLHSNKLYKGFVE